MPRRSLPPPPALAGLALLLALAACGGGEASAPAGDGPDPGSAGVPAAGPDAILLEDVTAAVGLAFTCETGPIDGHPLARIMGGGVALLDVEGDGDLDLYLVNGAERLEGGGGRPGAAVNRLFLQEDGRFRDATAGSGLGDDSFGMGVAVGDVDNDGRPDVYVTNYGPDRLYANRGDGTFEDVTAASGVDVPGWSCSATFLDLDRDGWLDLYVTRYVEDDPEKPCHGSSGKRDFCSPKAFQPAYDVLLRNRGDGTFEDVSARSGVASKAAPGLGVVAEDLDDDGWIDLYVANDGHANFLWRNRGDGTFEDVAIQYGVAFNARGAPEASMGVLAEDLDGDLRMDLFCTHLKNESNTLYGNLGTAFQDRTTTSGMSVASTPFTGFGTVALDVELDGDLDLALVNGRVLAGEVEPGAQPDGPWAAYAEPNQLLLQDRGHFAPVAAGAEALTGPVEISRGLAAGDLDRDGDLDLVLTNLRGPARVLQNVAPRRGAWLAVRALDPAHGGREALGARVVVEAGGRRFARTVRRASSYLSSSEPVPRFGLGPAGRVERIEVRWPDGAREVFAGCDVDREVVLRRGEGSAE